MYKSQYKELQVKDKPFTGLKVYHSESIRGVAESDPAFAWKLVSYYLLCVGDEPSSPVSYGG